MAKAQQREWQKTRLEGGEVDLTGLASHVAVFRMNVKINRKTTKANSKNCLFRRSSLPLLCSN